MATYESMEAPGTTERIPRYDLSSEELDLETRRFLGKTELPPGRFVCVAFNPDHPMADVGRTIERSVFEDEFKNDSGTMQQEYGPYERASSFLVVIDREEQRPAGVLRIIKPSPVGLKSFNDMTERFFPLAGKYFAASHGMDVNNCIDVGTLAVMPSHRGPRSSNEVNALLCRGLLLSARHEGVQNMITIIDRRARNGLEMLGILFDVVKGTHAFEYLGSKESYVMCVDVDELERRARATYEDIKTSTDASAGELTKVERIRRRLEPVITKLVLGTADGQIVAKPQSMRAVSLENGHFSEPWQGSRMRQFMHQLVGMLFTTAS